MPENTNIRPPCVVDMSNDDYHNHAGLSSSGLKFLAITPLHYWAKYLDPEREKKEPTPALILGNQIHSAVLEPDLFKRSYYPLPRKYDLRKTADKDEFAGHEAAAKAAGMQIITKENLDTCLRIAVAVRQSPMANQLMNGAGPVEQSFFWVEDVELDDGTTEPVLCKCRPDKLLTEANVCVDLKSCESAERETFMRACWNYKYYVSAAWYMRGIAAVTGKRPDAWVFCAHEKEAPYAAAFYQASADMLEAGDIECRYLLKKYAVCQRTNIWHGYNSQITEIGLPAWAASRTAAETAE